MNPEDAVEVTVDEPIQMVKQHQVIHIYIYDSDEIKNATEADGR